MFQCIIIVVEILKQVAFVYKWFQVLVRIYLTPHSGNIIEKIRGLSNPLGQRCSQIVFVDVNGYSGITYMKVVWSDKFREYCLL